MWLSLSLGAFIVAIAAHAGTVRIAAPGSAVAKYVATGGIIGLGLAAILYATDQSFIRILAGLLVYAFASELYIFLFTLVINSVSLGLMFRLLRQSMDEDEITRHYGIDAMVERRFEQLQTARLMQLENGKFVVTPQGHRLVTTFSALRRLFARD